MADVIKCPMCSTPNPANADVCEFCGARITPVTAPLETIRPGESPTVKKTSDLERTLPSWLRDARKAGTPSSEESSSQPTASDKDQDASDTGIPDSPKVEPEPTPEPEPQTPLDFLAGLAASADDEEEAPDWLKSLRSDLPEEEQTSAASKNSSLQDLMSAIEPTREPEPQQPASDSWGFDDQKFDFNDSAQDSSDFSFESETPDWLSALKNQQDNSPFQLEETAQPENMGGIPASDGDLPSWLNDLSGSGSSRTSSPQPDSLPNQPESTPSADVTPDWLASLSAETPSAAEPTPVAETGDTPDWLASLSAETSSAAEPTPIAETGDTPNWLASLSAETPSAAEPTPVAETGDTPDWLASLSAEIPSAAEPTPAAEAGDTPDWLASLSAETSSAAEPTPAAEAGDTPDWLASLSAETPSAAEPTPIAETGDTPDWLASLSAETSSATEPTPAAEAGDTPDWLASLSAETPFAETSKTPDWLASLSNEASSSEAVHAAEAGDTPDWLASLSTEATAVPTDDMPDWLSQSAKGIPAQDTPAQKEPQAFQTGSLGDIGSETPDWLASLGAETPPPASETPTEAENQAELGRESGIFTTEPESVSSPPFEFAAEESLQTPAGEENLDSFLSMDMPEWLSGFTPGDLEQTQGDAQAESALEEDLAPANLPSWVQAMRPVEAVVSDAGLGDDEQAIEQEGPLAGFRSVLPSLAGLLGSRKPKAYSMKLRADDVQQSQAALLDALVQAEHTARVVPERRKVAPDRLLRWVVAAILLVMIFVPSLLGTRLLPVPTQATSDLSDFISTIYVLEADAPVLVVMDYQPALAGEMEPSLSPVLNDLMIRGSRLGFISTLPTGSLMVARTMEQMQNHYGHNYQPGSQYIDLGYLPGDAAGIQSFVNRPQETMGLNGLNESFWNTPTLAGIKHLSDFTAIIVVTDNPDTGRIWIEQAGPALNGQPMLMVISAQAEPMLRPYYDSGQVSGMVTGLSGGAVYESIRQEPGLAHDYWDAYGFGLIATQLLILVGGTWNLITGILARRKEKELEEA